MTWKRFPHYWPFVRRMNRSPVVSLTKGQWYGALMFFRCLPKLFNKQSSCHRSNLASLRPSITPRHQSEYAPWHKHAPDGTFQSLSLCVKQLLSITLLSTKDGGKHSGQGCLQRLFLTPMHVSKGCPRPPDSSQYVGCTSAMCWSYSVSGRNRAV